MNAQDIWMGNEYAWASFGAPKGERVVYNCTRVRVKRIVKRKDFGKERYSSYALVDQLNDEGQVIREDREVRCRDITMRWDEYEEAMATIEREQAARAKKAADEEAAENTKKERIIAELESKGIPRLAITGVTFFNINLSRSAIEEWLGINE